MTTNSPYPSEPGSAGDRQGAYATSPYGQPVYPYYASDGSFTPRDTAEYAQYPYYGGQQFGPPWGPPPPPAAPKRTGRRTLVGVAAAAAAAVVLIGGVAIGEATNSNTVAGSGSSAQIQNPSTNGGSGSTNDGSGSANGGTVPGNGGSLPNGGSSSSGSGTTASATQQIGIVTIVSVLKYQSAESAGTGMILSSDGEILTNNHVVNGATSITVTVESTGKSYRADVVGTAPTKDVAVIQLRNASGLKTAKFADSSSDVAVGDAVTGVGNAGGTGTLTAASGKVTGLDKSITATDESGQDAERLRGLIEIDAPIISGDSGGPLYNSDGEIIGIDTAASATQSTTSAAYAIRIENADAIVNQIETGVQTTTIHIGLPGFLGIGTGAATGGVGVTSVLQGGPAAEAGLTAGSVITAIDGTRITTPAKLKATLSSKDPGTKVSLSWTDPSGASHTSSTTLVSGPAD